MADTNINILTERRTGIGGHTAFGKDENTRSELLRVNRTFGRYFDDALDLERTSSRTTNDPIANGFRRLTVCDDTATGTISIDDDL